MLAKIALLTAAITLMAPHVRAQSPDADAPTPEKQLHVGRWRNVNSRIPRDDPASADRRDDVAVPGPVEPLRPVAERRYAPTSADADAKPDGLPADQGQVWREYDISTYTTRVTTTNRPEQAIVDWILRETGYETWHSEPLSVLSATSRVLRVYHTPEMQDIVAQVVDRFVDSQAETHAFGLRVITIDSPNWRARAHRMLHPVDVQTPGVQAWLLAKEDAALLLAELRRRTDFREHTSPHLLVNNGQSTVVTATRTRSYTKDVALRAENWPAFDPEFGQVDEGFSLELAPLLSIDGEMIDAVLKCNIDQVEKMAPVVLEVPSQAAPRQRTTIEVPQISSVRLHERFRWPATHVLLVGLGMAPTPVPVEPNALIKTLSLPTGPPRADLLVLVESRGAPPAAPPTARAARSENRSYHGRY